MKKMFLLLFLIHYQCTSNEISNNKRNELNSPQTKNEKCITNADSAIVIGVQKMEEFLKRSLNERKPFVAKQDENGDWWVIGSFDSIVNKGVVNLKDGGGYPYVKLSAKDCSILEIGQAK